MKRWWVITYPPKERDRIIEQIGFHGLDMDYYCPMVETVKTDKGRLYFDKKTLLYNYMFLLFNIEDYSYDFLSTLFHFRFVKFGGRPRFITTKDIRRIKKMVRGEDNLFRRIREDVNHLRKYIGRSLIIRDGAFNGMVGVVSDVRKSGMLDVHITIFNRSVVCEVSVDYVEFI